MRTAVYSSYSVYPTVVAKKQQHPKPHKDTDSTPRRITSNVRQNLRFIKLREQRNNKAYQPQPVSGYRRKKGAQEEKQEDVNSDNTTQESLTEDLVVMVDAYNLCGQWEELKPDFLSGRISTARDKLIESLITFSEIRDMKVVAVFDSTKSGKRANQENVAGVDIVYSGGIEADEWIIREVETLKEAGFPALVITSDIYVKNELLEMGAYVWSCDTFISGIKDAEKEYSENVERERVKAIRHSNMSVKYALPLDVPALQKLKKKLVDEDSSNATTDEASTTPPSTPDPATTNLNSASQSNGSVRKEKVQIVKLKKRGYGSFFHTLEDLRDRIS